MKCTSFALPLVVACVAGWSGSASAHIKLKSPVSRDPNNEQKDAPCGPSGNLPRGSTMMVLEPGAKLTVTWDETIQHPGHYRIAFDSDGQDFPDPTSFTDIGTTGKDLGNGVTILLDGIADQTGPFIGATPYSAEVTLPAIECENCTLQLIQVMTDKAPYGDGNDIYHECGNIVLRRAAGSGGAGGAAAAGSGGAGSNAAAAGSGAGGSGAAGSGAAAGRGSAGAPSAAGAGGSPIVASSGAGAGASGGAGQLGAAGIGTIASGATAGGAPVAAGTGAVAPSPASSESGGCAVAEPGARRVTNAWLVPTALCIVYGWRSRSGRARLRSRPQR